MAVAVGRDVVNHTVVSQFHLKVIPIPSIYISSANASHKGLEGEPTIFGEQSLLPLSLITLCQQTSPCFDALHYTTPYPMLYLLV